MSTWCYYTKQHVTLTCINSLSCQKKSQLLGEKCQNLLLTLVDNLQFFRHKNFLKAIESFEFSVKLCNLKHMQDCSGDRPKHDFIILRKFSLKNTLTSKPALYKKKRKGNINTILYLAYLLNSYAETGIPTSLLCSFSIHHNLLDHQNAPLKTPKTTRKHLL